MLTKFKIKSLGIKDKEYNKLPFGRKLEYAKKIEEFKATALQHHVGQKRKTHAKAWKEFLDLYEVDEYFAQYEDSEAVRDDSFLVYYTTTVTA